VGDIGAERRRVASEPVEDALALPDPNVEPTGPPGHPDGSPARRQQDLPPSKTTEGGTVDPGLGSRAMTTPAYAKGFDDTIGLQISSATPDEVRATLTVTPDLLQPYGLLHGGVLCTIVESIGSVAGAVWYGDRGRVVGTSNHTNFLRSVTEGTLTGVATPIHRGRTQQLWSIDIRDEQERLIAKGELRVANLPHREEPTS